MKLLNDTFLLIFLCLFCFKNLSFVLRKQFDFKLGREKDHGDKDKNEIVKADSSIGDIDNEITRLKMCVMIRDGKKKKETQNKERVGVVMEMWRNQL